MQDRLTCGPENIAHRESTADRVVAQLSVSHGIKSTRMLQKFPAQRKNIFWREPRFYPPGRKNFPGATARQRPSQRERESDSLLPIDCTVFTVKVCALNPSPRTCNKFILSGPTRWASQFPLPRLLSLLSVGNKGRPHGGRSFVRE